jgi:NADPH:quinone reductase-like Zn-dependent oxidoreductase
LTAWQGLLPNGTPVGFDPWRIGRRWPLRESIREAKGTRVAATVSSDHVRFARELGADQVINHRKQRFEDEVGKVVMVYDLVGGTLVSTLTEPSQARAELGARGLRYTAEESGEDLTAIARLIDAGQSAAGRR